MQYHSGGDSVVLGIAPASPTSWDLGPRLHNIRFGVGGTLNSMKDEKERCLISVDKEVNRLVVVFSVCFKWGYWVISVNKEVSVEFVCF